MSLSTLEKPQTQSPRLTPIESSPNPLHDAAQQATYLSKAKQSFKIPHPMPSPFPLPMSPVQRESNPSMLSSSKVTADYVAQWDNPADRERNLGRFKSFDEPGREGLERGPSILSKADGGNNATKDSSGNLRKVNVVTKLPTLNNDSGSKAHLLEQ